MNTIQELESVAYITNSPNARLLGMLVDEEWEHHDEMRHEIDMLKIEVKDQELMIIEKQEELELVSEKLFRYEDASKKAILALEQVY